MQYHQTILNRSFGRHDRKKLGCAALIACCVMAFTLSTAFKPFLVGPLPAVNLVLQLGAPLKILMVTGEIRQPQQSYHVSGAESTKEPIIHNLTNSKSQVWEMTGDIRIHGNSSTIFLASTQQPHHKINLTTKPYARDDDKVAMGKVRTFSIIGQPPLVMPRCTRSFTSPAIVLSLGGYAGNHFHDFTDVLIPLYLTSRQFNATVLFLVADNHSWWILKYKAILKKLSKYEIIDIDREDQVLCFPRMIVGLRAHKELSIDPLESPHYSLRAFTRFLRSSYSLDRHSVNDHERRMRSRGPPRLLIVSRKKSRHLTNEGEVAHLARSLGFHVEVKELGWPLSSVATLVNSFDVMVGVHGAGLTNIVFLPEGAVFIQITAFGLEELARSCFQMPAKDMGLMYLEYKVSLNESSLSGKYPPESEIYRDPVAVREKGWHGFRSVYLDAQDVTVDLGRFRKTLSESLELLRA